ncbi:Glutathione import ATP-binding protein GsiA [Sporomusa carbonis]|uniref:ABC transporter ATP-binding protein n=1 Tax=Sporomusa carbonis TaxID=3076075 RepID=UPI003A666F5F
MEQSVLQVKNLFIGYGTGEQRVQAVDDISLSLEKGGSLGIIGESGSGKTTLALALMGLLDKTAAIGGTISYCGENLQQLSETERNYYRWRRLALVFQNSLDVLNPVLTIYEQIYECLKKHTGLRPTLICEKINNLFKMVGLEPFWQEYYPHQLSGGIRQRVLLAMALSCDPDILIVDEPTNALDAVSKQEIIDLIYTLHQERKFGLMVISHEMKTVSRLASRLIVMYNGRIVEEGLTKDILNHPMHNYTRGLLNSSPDINPYRDLWGIPGETAHGNQGGCSFYPRCNQRIEYCKTNKPSLEYVSLERKVACNRKGIVTLLQASGICKTYKSKGKRIKVCDNCGIDIRAGEAVALIGQSGSGKTTLASIIGGVLAADAGEVFFNGEKVTGYSATCRQNGIQIVFQDPYSSVNEQFTVEEAIREPLDVIRRDCTLEQRTNWVKDALSQVQLPSEDSFLARRCHTLSGGQRQRIALARAMVMQPSILIADEISSMLDPSTQANILRLLKGLQNRKGFAMLYITHDLAVAQKIADRVYVMYQGKIIEKGNAQHVFTKPVQAYTKKLLDGAATISLC